MTQKKILKSQVILGIETLWFHNVAMPKSSILPILEMIYHDTKVPFGWFTANTREELRFIFSKFNNDNPGILYLASHGGKGRFSFGEGNMDYLTLMELGNFLKNRLRGRAIHISSCETFNVDNEDVIRFKRNTGALLVSGYTESVDWMESSALDMLYLSYMQKSWNDIDKFVKSFMNDHLGLVERNGLKIII